MNIWTWRPGWDPLGELQRQVDRLFDFSQDVSRQFYQTWRQFPAFNMYEAPTEYLLVAPMPGIKPDDLDVSITGNSLTIKGERRRSGDAPDEAYRRMERWQGKWARTIQMPDNVDAERLNASLDNGVLYLRVPKAPEGQPRQVHVKAGSNS